MSKCMIVLESIIYYILTLVHLKAEIGGHRTAHYRKSEQNGKYRNVVVSQRGFPFVVTRAKKESRTSLTPDFVCIVLTERASFLPEAYGKPWK